MRENLDAERQLIPALPDTDAPELSGMTGAAAIENGELIGFLCAPPPHDHAFGTAAKGIFSPLHANGVTRNTGTDRARVMTRLYTYAAERWTALGANYHALSVFAHDTEITNALFNLNFGRRCADAIFTSVEEPPPVIFTLRELDREEIPLVRELRIKLSDHLACSPCFMRTSEKELADRISAAEKSGTRLFAAFDDYRTVAFIEVGDSGETYLTWNTGMKSICGAYCLPEYRGKGVMQALVCLAKKETRARYLGVDLETMNPAAAGFWKKQFTFYTSGLTRRVDEKA